MSLRLAAAGLVAVLLVVLIGALTPNSPRTAVAQDAETDALIWHFNVYRVQNGAPPLYTDSRLSADTQANALKNADACAISYLPDEPTYASAWVRWNTLGGTGDTVWAQYENDPVNQNDIADPKFNSVGIGRATHQGGGCASGTIWSIELARINGAPAGAAPTPTGPATPTPVTPVHTTPAPSLNPTQTLLSSETPTVTPTPSPSASATPYVPVNGDADCNGAVTITDGMLVLLVAADFATNAPCLDLHGVDCTALVNEFDVLALFRYLGGVASGIPPDCPALGLAATPSPTPTAVVTPTATATPEPTTPVR